MTCGVCQHKTRIAAFRTNPKEFLNLNRNKTSVVERNSKTKTSKKRRLSGISNGKASKKSKIQSASNFQSSTFSSNVKRKKVKKKETLKTLIKAQIQRTQTQEKETFTLHDFLKQIQW
jgi:tRNA C32,U32 (ribose-2'-O)-methylase TrmJ